MQNNFGIKDLTEGAMLTALTMGIIICAAYIPGFMIVGMVASSVPMACLVIRRNIITSVISVIVCIALSIFITHSIVGAIEVACIMILPGFAAGVCFYKRTNFFVSLISVCSCVIAGMIFSIFMLNTATNGNGIKGIIEEVAAPFEQTLKNIISNTYNGIQKISTEELSEAVAEIITQIKEMILFYFPSAVLIIAVVFGYLQLMLCAFIVKKTRSGFPNIIPFNRMKAPKSMCYLTAVLFLMSLFMSQSSVVDAALMNVNIILYFIIGICGFSLIDDRVAQKIPGGIFRVMIYIGAVMLGGALIGFLLNGLILVGMLDSMIDFRKLGKAGENYADKK